MSQSFNVQFYCRSSKATKNGYAPLEIAININGVRKFVNLPYKCLPSDFNRKRQPQELIDYQAAMRRKINEILAEFAGNDIPVTTDNLKEYLKYGGNRSYTIENLFDEYFEILRKRIGTTLSKSVYRKYELVRDAFFEVVKKSAETSTITHSQVLSFKAIIEARYTTSTSGGYLQKLKTVLTFAQDNGKLKTNPFQGVKINKGTPKMEFLTPKEIDMLKNLHIENESLRNVRDLFIFQISCGLSYGDLKKLKPEDIQAKNDAFFIKKNRQKTGVEYISVLLPFAADYLETDGGKVTGFRFKAISSQKTTAYLHEIERMYGFKKSLHSHLARHTYAHLLLNEYGVRAETVAKAMGHTSSKMTLKYYANVMEDTTVNEISSKFSA